MLYASERKNSRTLIARRVVCLLAALSLSCSLALAGCSVAGVSGGASSSSAQVVALEEVPEYTGEAYVEVEGNTPAFSDDERTAAEGTEVYGDLDELGRCTGAFAVVGEETAPTEERGAIGSVKPTGWHLVKYDIVDGKYLYNRCHLIGYQLTAENANECNLITGTRYLNVEGMLPFENEVAEYVEETGNHVLYRVTPLFEGDEPVARGVQMEAESLEDDGAGVSFNVYCYNVQPGISIDYTTGDSELASEGTITDGTVATTTTTTTTIDVTAQGDTTTTYVLNTNTLKFHLPTCSSVTDIKAKNRKSATTTRSKLIAQGYTPCSRCNP